MFRLSLTSTMSSRAIGAMICVLLCLAGEAFAQTNRLPTLGSTSKLTQGAVCRIGTTEISTQSGEIFSNSFELGSGEIPWSQWVGAGEPATLTINVFYDENMEYPGVAGIHIRLNHVGVGMTNANGSLTVQHAPVPVFVKAIDPGLDGGFTEIVLSPGENRTIDLFMLGGEAMAEEATLQIDELAGVLLDDVFTSLNIHFVDLLGKAVSMETLDQVSVDVVDGEPIYLTKFFARLPDGAVHVTDLLSVLNIFQDVPGQIDLSVSATDAQGIPYYGNKQFFLGSNDLQGSFVAPPSNPDLPTAGILLTANLLGTDVICQVTSDASGQFVLPQIPSGVFSLSANTLSAGKVYSVSTLTPINSDTQTILTLLTIEDIVDGVPEAVTTTPQQPEIKRELLNLKTRPPTMLAPILGTSVSVFAVAGTQNFPVTRSAALTVPPGTERLTLRYIVSTAEYPTYVLAQSQFNDSWQTRVMASNGKQLFAQYRNVNSQTSASPTWQRDGTTGELLEIVEEFDVSTAMTKGETTFTVVATAMNVGDSILPTSVSATLEVTSPLRINKITPDKLRGKYFSIPRPGATNNLQRSFTLDLVRPKGSTIDNVRVDLIQANGTTEMTILDESPGTNVTIINDKKISVQVTMKGGNSSTIDSVPPRFHDMTYRFTVEASVGTEISTDEKESPTRYALWRMPDGLPRFGPRDTGGDNWVARETYDWIFSQTTPLPAINDISGEHARYIGHRTHRKGTDIDIYHFTNLLSGAPQGSANYNVLANAVVAAISGNVAAKTTVTSWFEVARQRLTSLANQGKLARIIFANGKRGAMLPDGWTKSLLTDGTVTSNNGVTLDLNIGSWESAKVIHNNGHNNHSHIDLIDSPS